MSNMLAMPNLDALQKRLGVKWPQISAARTRSVAKWAELQGKLKKFDSADTSIVVFGSLARGEFTEKSDIDWTLLIDGKTDPKHLAVTQEIGKIIHRAAKKPGREGTFGNMTASHDLIHLIGGEDDTNKNTTRRILLLLESATIEDKGAAYEGVVRNVLTRYLAEDHGFLNGKGGFHVPRFLLNDFARFWRTMAVDFAYKQRTRLGNGYAIRNLKLRMSRKLIYASGLLACFNCHCNCQKKKTKASIPECVDCLQKFLKMPPLEKMASFLTRYPHLDAAAGKMLPAYDQFLGILADKKKRDRLEKLPAEKENTDSLYQKGRNFSREFQDGLLELFFDKKSGMLPLTKEYGVF